MNDENRKKLKEIFFRNFPNLDKENFDFNKNRSEFENWDSLAHLQLVSDIESAFHISFQMDEIVDINKPEDLFILIQKKQNA